MKLSALLLAAGLGLVAIGPAGAKTPEGANDNVKHALRKPRKFKPAKYKAPKKSKKPKAAKYGVSHLPTRHT
jgi:hypothetical protein